MAPEATHGGAYTERMSVASTVRRIPVARLLAVAEVLLLARQHLLKLEPQERQRIVELVRRGRGRGRNLTERERRELHQLVQKAEPREFAKTAAKKLVGLPLRGRSAKDA